MLVCGKSFPRKMGNSQTSTSNNDSSKCSLGKNRRNSNVRGRVLARFGHRKSVPKDLNKSIEIDGAGGSRADGDFSSLQIGNVDTKCSTTYYRRTSSAAAGDGEHSSEDDFNKRLSQFSQCTADSAKDALDFGEFSVLMKIEFKMFSY